MQKTRTLEDEIISLLKKETAPRLFLKIHKDSQDPYFGLSKALESLIDSNKDFCAVNLCPFGKTPLVQYMDIVNRIDSETIMRVPVMKDLA
jgi:hypothetical protein